jgi:hypothetical protein
MSNKREKVTASLYCDELVTIERLEKELLVAPK